MLCYGKTNVKFVKISKCWTGNIRWMPWFKFNDLIAPDWSLQNMGAYFIQSWRKTLVSSYVEKGTLGNYTPQSRFRLRFKCYPRNIKFTFRFAFTSSHRRRLKIGQNAASKWGDPAWDSLPKYTQRFFLLDSHTGVRGLELIASAWNPKFVPSFLSPAPYTARRRSSLRKIAEGGEISFPFLLWKKEIFYFLQKNVALFRAEI